MRVPGVLAESSWNIAGYRPDTVSPDIRRSYRRSSRTLAWTTWTRNRWTLARLPFTRARSRWVHGVPSVLRDRRRSQLIDAVLCAPLCSVRRPLLLCLCQRTSHWPASRRITDGRRRSRLCRTTRSEVSSSGSCGRCNGSSACLLGRTHVLC